VSKSGPNIKPPNAKQTVTTKDNGTLSVIFHVAAKTGATKRNVIASCVFPEGTFDLGCADLGFRIWRENPLIYSNENFGDYKQIFCKTLSAMLRFGKTPRENAINRRFC